MTDPTNLVNDVLAAPLGDVIASVGAGVAAAQHALDEASLAAVLDIYTDSDDERLRLLRAIGYRPTFYALPETTGEVRVALRMGSGAAGTGGQAVRPQDPGPTAPQVSVVPARLGLNLLPAKLYATPVDAGYANRYGYTADISATLTFKIVPVPPPQGADELRVMPDLMTRPAGACRATLQALGLVPRFVDVHGSVVSPTGDEATTGQTPAAGTILSLGDEVLLTVTTAT